MSDLKEAAEQFMENLITQNMGGLMATFTPEGMSKAMAMGQGPQPSGLPTKKEVVLGEANGEDHSVELQLATADQEIVIGTVWRQGDGERPRTGGSSASVSTISLREGARGRGRHSIKSVTDGGRLSQLTIEFAGDLLLRHEATVY
jgi:hypothetical protein